MLGDDNTMFKRVLTVIITSLALFCFTISAEAASNNWLIYWYVCGTDIETTRIDFKPGTDLMSDDPNKLILAEPDREPGDATRCIKEVEKANLSNNVRIFMQAGGTYIWGHEKFRDLNAKIQTGLSESNVIGNGNAYYSAWNLRKDIAPQAVIMHGKLGRYVYDKNHRNWIAREKLPISGIKGSETDMGSQAGFISFLRAGQQLEKELYPDGNVRRVLIFVDHGNGSINYFKGEGVLCFDEYTGKALSLKDIQNAFSQVQNDWTNPNEKPFEVIAIDACEMSTYETAVALEDAANYMVASQEVMYGKVMLNYTGLLNNLSRNPSMSGKELGKVICNTCWEDSKITDKEFNFNSNAVFTLSVIDLSNQKMDALKTAYSNFGAEALKLAKQNPDEIVYNFSKFRNAARVAERYPSYDTTATMIDLRNFAENLGATLPELKESSNALVQSISNSIVYNKRGNVLNRGGGLSTYYPSDLMLQLQNPKPSIQNMAKFEVAQIQFYRQLANENLAPESQSELYGFLCQNIQGKYPDLSILSGKNVELDEENKSISVKLSEEELKNIDSVRYQLILVVPRNDGTKTMDAVLLGSDSDMEEDRQTGTFTINFDGKKWYSLNDTPLYVQVVSDATRKGKNGKKIGGNDICVAPILLNDKPYKLFFSRNYPDGKVTIIGAVPNEQKDMGTNLPSGMLENLKKGDVVTPLYILVKDTGDIFNPYEMPGTPIVIGNNPKMKMRTLSDGILGYAFEFVNPIGSRNALTKEGAFCTFKNGKIVKVTHSDYVDDSSDL